MKNNHTNSRFSPIKISVISAGHLCHDIYTSFLAPLLPILINKMEMTYASAGFISVMLRLPSLFNPFIGAFADRFQLKYLVILSPTVTAIAMCFIGRVPSYSIIVLLILIAGISSSCFHVPSPVIIKQFSGKRIGAAMSSFQIGGELARTIGPLIVLSAVSFWTIEGIYRLIPIALLISFVLYWILRDLPNKPQKSKHNVCGSIIETLKSDKILFISISGISLSKSFTASILTAFLPIYLIAKGENLWFSGGALSILQAAAIVGVFISGTLSDKIGSRRILIILTILSPFLMLLFLSATGWIFFVFLILLGISAFAFPPVILASIQKQGFSYPSIANGVYMSINFLSSSLTILLAGKLSDIFGIVSTFYLFAFCSFIGIPFAFWFGKS